MHLGVEKLVVNQKLVDSLKMAATVIRVKRMREEEPVEKLLISSKRRKESKEATCNQEDEENQKHLFHRIGTVSGSELPLSKRIREALQLSVIPPSQIKMHQSHLRDKLKHNSNLHRDESRYNVLCKHRGIQIEHITKSNLEITSKACNASGDESRSKDRAPIKETEQLLQIYDVMKDDANDKTNTEGASDSKKENQQTVLICSDHEVLTKCHESSPFVFDIYCTSGTDIASDDDDISITAFDEDYMSENQTGLEEYDTEDSDSNAEDNWRNDYPDTDPDADSDNKNSDTEGDDTDYINNYGVDYDKHNNVEAFSRFCLDEDDDSDTECPGWSVCI